MFEEDLRRAYVDFEPFVKNIEDNNNAQFVGQGAESSVWRVRLDGVNYAVKYANTLSVRGMPRNIVAATAGKMASGMRGFGVNGIEQIKAGSLDNGVVIYNFVDGIAAQDLTADAISQISPQQIQSFKQTVRDASERNIEFDGWNNTGGNAIYRSDSGFTLIDYWAGRSEIKYEDNLKYAVRSLGRAGVTLFNL